jgi:hypothetical protein
MLHIFFIMINSLSKQQVFAMPVFDMIETVMVKNLDFSPTFALRFSVRTLFVGMSYTLLDDTVD